MTDIIVNDIQQLLLPFHSAGLHIESCTTCDETGERHLMHEVTDWAMYRGWSHATRNTILVCEVCRDDCYHLCERCDEFTSATVDTADGGEVCPGCAQGMVRCDDCRMPTDDTTEVDPFHDVCQSCCESNYSYCHDCDAYYDSSEWDCPNCQNSESSEHIHDYSYRPIPNFLGTGPVYLGMELEVSMPAEYIRDCADIAIDALGYQEEIGYLKEDGSITGFEIVTHPMSYEYAMHNFPWRLLRELRDNGADENSYDAGLHVHVSRKGFASPAHIYRWLQFFYRNPGEIRRLARRESSYAEFSDSHRAEFLNFARGSRYGARYQAVNVLNRDTFEVRVFASSLYRRDVRAALALVAASVEYTRTLTCRDVMAGGLNFAQFATWVDARQDVYPDLFAQIVEA